MRSTPSTRNRAAIGPRNKKAVLTAVLASLAVAGCGGATHLINSGTTTTSVIAITQAPGKSGQSAASLGIPVLATKNTTRVAGNDPVADAVGVALAVYPSEGQGTHPSVVTIAPIDDWQASLAASVLMAPPVRAPILFAGSGSFPSVTTSGLSALAPTGSGSVGGAQVIRIGDVPKPPGLRSAAITGSDPYSLAAAIDRFWSAAHGSPSSSVVIAPGDNPAYAMPAAGWAAESGDPILFVNGSTVPSATRQALLAHQKPHIYVLAPLSVIPDSDIRQLQKYGPVKRISARNPILSSVAFAEYRDPACAFGQPCAHVPGSFGWAMRSPGHGYILINAHRPLDAAAAAPLSSSGDYGPELLIDNPSTLPPGVLSFFLNYATPGYTQEGPTAAVYNHGWVIGDTSVISGAVQAQMDGLLEAVPQK